MKRTSLVCLFQCLITTLLFAQLHPALSGPQAAQDFSRYQLGLQGAFPRPDQGPFGSGGLLRRPPFSPRHQAREEAAAGLPFSSRRAQRHGYKSSIQGNFQNLTTDASAIFLEAPTYSSGGFDAASIAVADVNGDGKPDLLVANECGNLPDCPNGVVAVLLGNGDGTFQAAQTYSSGGYAAASIAVADVNGDGKPDLVVGNFDGTVGVLLGNGDGTFQAAQTYSSGGDLALSIAVGDVNGDGKPDLIVGDACASDSNCANGVVAVLLGKGDGTFQAAHTYNSGGYSEYAISIAVADVNGDGKLDLLVANDCTSGSNGCTNYAGVVGVLLGNGDGTFQAAQTYNSGGLDAQSIAVADVNGDGKPDLLVANDCSSSGNGCATTGSVGVLLGNGDGTFQKASAYNTSGPFAFSIAVADVNGDGKPDLLVASRGIEVLLGNGDGTFKAPRTYSSGGYNAFSIAVGDVNGDGKPDVVTANDCPGPGCGNAGEVEVLLGNGNGTFRAAPSYSSGGYYADSIAVADVNGDGKPDLLVANECADSSCTTASIGVLLGKGDGTFQAVRTYNLGDYYAFSIAVADVNGDGKLDLLVAGDTSSTSSGSVGVLLGNGDGTFQPVQYYGSGGYYAFSIAVGDVNSDGKLDLLVSNQCASLTGCSFDNEPGSVGVLLGNGDGTFQAAQTYNSGGYYAQSLAVADVNGDGKLDLVVANQCFTTEGCYVYPPALGGVSVLLGNGDGTFQAAQNYSSGGYKAWSIAVGDVNGDGKPDLLVINGYADNTYVEGGLGVLLGNGDGTFQTAETVSAFNALTAGQVALADFNDDGKLDVATGELGVLLLGNGDGSFQLPVALGSIGEGTTVGDFNGDGKPDLAVGNGGNSWGLTILLNIVPGTTTASLTSSPNPSEFKQPVTFTATVVPQFRGKVTGIIIFKDGVTTLGSVAVSGNIARLTTSCLAVGTHSITAVYGGDSNFTGNTSIPLTQIVKIVNKATTTTALVSSINPSVSGKSVSFTVTVSSSAGTPTGKVQFIKGTTVLVTLRLASGSAEYTTSKLPPGANIITAVYEGDSNDSGSTSAPLIQVVLAATTTTSTSSPNPSTYGRAVTFTATVTSSIGAPHDEETVTFKQGATVLGTGTLSGGTATSSTSTLGVGTKVIKLVYGGDASFASSTSAPVSQVRLQSREYDDAGLVTQPVELQAVCDI
jgi:hypothetical protein